jgi:hypothetical protein
LKRTLWRLAAASLGAATALSLNVGAASALNPPGDQHPPVRFPHGPVQVADQAARTDQDAHSFAKSTQIIPINANVPVQILSLGHNGGDTKQSNSSSASSAAVNEAGTKQSIDQHQGSSYPKGQYEVPRYDGHKPHPEKSHGPKDRCRKGEDEKSDHDRKDRGPKGDRWNDGPKGPEGHPPAPPVQVADQHARTHQDADSKAKSEQFLPINANVPVQLLSLGHNGGDTWQSNRSSAESFAGNQAWTGQSIDQDQHAPSKGDWDGRDGGKDRDSKGYDGHDSKGYGPESHGPRSPEGAFQGASQWAGTNQDARSKAESTQFVPVNVNAPIQVLSLGSNGGDTKQSNSSAAESAAVNKAGTEQSVDQNQQTGNGGWGHDGGAFQGSSQGASTDQQAESAATSKQILPVNVNAPIQVLSLGSNGGDTKQSNSSSAESAAANKAWTDQSADQQQAAGGQGGGAFQGASQGASTDQEAGSHAKSEQVLPVNLNIPVQALSLGHNGGDTAQSNSSSASSAAANQAGTSQGVGQAQGGLLGLTG